MVVNGAPGFTGNDTDYARLEMPPERYELPGFDSSARYSSLDGSHRVFVLTYHGEPTIAVTNNPFDTNWNDICLLNTERF